MGILKKLKYVKNLLKRLMGEGSPAPETLEETILGCGHKTSKCSMSFMIDKSPTRRVHYCFDSDDPDKHVKQGDEPYYKVACPECLALKSTLCALTGTIIVPGDGVTLLAKTELEDGYYSHEFNSVIFQGKEYFIVSLNDAIPEGSHYFGHWMLSGFVSDDPTTEDVGILEDCYDSLPYTKYNIGKSMDGEYLTLDIIVRRY